jgi:hypothetical protein
MNLKTAKMVVGPTRYRARLTNDVAPSVQEFIPRQVELACLKNAGMGNCLDPQLGVALALGIEG